MNRVVPVVAAVIGATILQAGLAPFLAIGGVTPNFYVLVVITLALTSGPTAGASAGFACGLLFDLMGNGPVGPGALVLTTTGYLAGLLHEQMFAEGWLLPLTVLATASFAAEFAYGLILAILGQGGNFWWAVLTKILPGAVYNTALALLFYPWLARFLRRDKPMTTFRRLA